MQLTRVARVGAKLSLGVLLAVLVTQSAGASFFPEVVALVWLLVGVSYALRRELLLFVALAAIGGGGAALFAGFGREVVAFVTTFAVGLGLASVVQSDLRGLTPDRPRD